jgi:hypothetical protein
MPRSKLNGGPAEPPFTDSATAKQPMSTARVQNAEAAPLQRRGRPGICWRCGQPFRGTTEAILRNCAELAAAAS